jgi:hypothetical protein
MNQKVVFGAMFVVSISVLALFIEQDSGTNYDIDDLEERIDITWNYDYSNNVIYGELIENHVIESNDKQCSFNVSDIRVIESFKGKYKVGDIFTTTGISAHETSEEHTEHLLFLKDLKVSEYPGFGDCNKQEYTHFQSIHNWCCSIVDGAPSKQLLMYDMINSETSSKRYTVDAEIVFIKLRKL